MASIEDRWQDKHGKPNARAGKGRRWKVIWWEGTKRKSESFAMKRDAISRKAELEIEADRGATTLSRRELRGLTMRAVAEAFREKPLSVYNAGRTLSQSYLSTVGALPGKDGIAKGGHLARIIEFFGDTPMTTLARDRAKLLAFLHFIRDENIGTEDAPKYRSAATVNRYMQTVSVLFAYPFEVGMIDAPLPKPRFPFMDVPPPDLDEDYVFTKEQMRRMPEVAPERYRAFIMLATHTGARMSELRGLTMEHLTLDGPNPRIRFVQQAARENAEMFAPLKDKEQRTVPINVPALLTELRRHIEATAEDRAKRPDLNVVFPTSKGTMFARTNIRQRAYLPIKEALNLPAGADFHHIRRTYGTLLYLATGDIAEVAAVLGHEKTDVTLQHYIRRSPERVDKVSTAVAMMYGD